VCALARDFLQEQDFPERNLLQRASRTPEELQRGSQSGEDCSGVLLAPRWSRAEPVFPHVVSSDEIAPREILLLEEISGLSNLVRLSLYVLDGKRSLSHLWNC
jgi:hypothetical protein